MNRATRLVLLGTAGGPGGHTRRAGIASLVCVGERNYLVDAGEGVSRQLAGAGFHVGDVDAVFLSHLHDDHTAGLPGLVSFRHTMRRGPLALIGPPGTELLGTSILAYMSANAAIRGTESSTLADATTMLHVIETDPGVIYEDDFVTVTAVENTHFALTEFSGTHRSYALRFDTSDRSIVFSGDTGESDAVERLARDADVLVSEMVTEADAASVPPPVRAHMLAEHLLPEQVGRLAHRAQVRQVVLSHYTDASASDIAAIAAEFGGEIVAGEDLMRL